MKRRLVIVIFAAVYATAGQSANACKYCQGGGEYDRYGNQDPMNAVELDALIEPYRDMNAPVPKPEEIVTTKAALAQAAATAVPQPGAAVAPNLPNSFRSRLLSSNPVATAPVIAAEPDNSQVKPIGKWTSHLLDASILGALVGVVIFFRRGARRQTA